VLVEQTNGRTTAPTYGVDVSTGAEVARVRVSELVAALSYAADLGLGQPLAHCMRKTALALRMADLFDATAADREATFYAGLMANVYCHADSAEQASWFGDDIAFRSGGFAGLDQSTPQVIAHLLRVVASHGSGVRRARNVAALPGMRKRVSDFLTTHATLASEFAEQIGLHPSAATAIRQTYEQWDGKGLPQHLSGEQIGLPARLTHFAAPVEVFGRHGADAARRVARRHRGTQFDPGLVDVFCDHATELLDGLEEAADWDVFLDAEPTLSRTVGGESLDRVLEAMADLVDMKSPYFAGHSRGVANLVAAAATMAGWPPDDITVLRRAALLHDLGRLGVSNSVLDRAGRLSAADRERVRLHPYLTERMLAGVGALERSRVIAGRHHERLDGSGYPHGLTAAVLTPADRLLAAADAYHAMTEPRPHREPLTSVQAAQVLRAQATAGKLDAAATAAVLTAAGHRASARPMWPAGMTDREAQILTLVARGLSNRQIAARLVLAPKTVSNHVEHIYTKIGASSRAAATLFATRHGLVGAYEAG
jgi:HD-GYP domain-containing protein (c-di-GMP phosphodiesterase class II)